MPNLTITLDDDFAFVNWLYDGQDGDLDANKPTVIPMPPAGTYLTFNASRFYAPMHGSGFFTVPSGDQDLTAKVIVRPSPYNWSEIDVTVI